MENRIRFLVGIDGGGTSCRARICDLSGNTLGEGKTGSANLLLGVENAMAAVVEAIELATGQAGLTQADFPTMSVGLALAAAEHEPSWQQFMALEHPFGHITLNTDAYGACLGAWGGDDGAILIAGTGAIGLLVANGKQHQVGGYGFPISDQGSGAVMGLRLVQKSLLVRDGVLPPSQLAEQVFKQFDNDIDRLISWSKKAAPRDYGEFCPMIFRYAAAHDPLAESLLRQTAADIEMWLDALRVRGASQVCLMGSIGERILPWLSSAAREQLASPIGDAMDGALAMAQRSDCNLYPLTEQSSEAAACR